MKRVIIVLGAVVGAVALLGAGLAVGSKMGQEQAITAAAEAQGPLTEKDMAILSTFSEASQEFETLLGKAQKGKKVGDKLTEQAVIVLHVERSAEGPKFKEAVGDAGDAMLLLSAGVITDDGATVEEGIEAYKASQEKLVELAEEVQAAKDEQSGSDSENNEDQQNEDQPNEEPPAQDQPSEEPPAQDQPESK